MFQRILVPTDGSELSARAVAGAIELAKLHGSSLVALNVQAPFRVPPIAELPSAQYFSAEKYEENVREVAGDILGRVADQARASGVACEIATAMYDSPYQAIIEMAERKGCDLIFMASHGRRGVAGMLLGSETQKVLTHCKVPVLVYR